MNSPRVPAFIYCIVAQGQGDASTLARLARAVNSRLAPIRYETLALPPFLAGRNTSPKDGLCSLRSLAYK